LTALAAPGDARGIRPRAVALVVRFLNMGGSMKARVPFLALAIGGLLAACGSEPLGTRANPTMRTGGSAIVVAPEKVQQSGTTSATSLTIGPLVLSSIDPSFSGPNWHFRDAVLTGAVTGSLAGTAVVTLHANLDGLPGSGPAWGTVKIVTAGGDIWEGALTGHFLGAPDGIQLFSQVVLHGPDQQTLRAECDETSAPSEILVCSGSTLKPHG
jgi:hypothetical protein